MELSLLHDVTVMRFSTMTGDQDRKTSTFLEESRDPDNDSFEDLAAQYNLNDSEPLEETAASGPWEPMEPELPDVEPNRLELAESASKDLSPMKSYGAPNNPKRSAIDDPTSAKRIKRDSAPPTELHEHRETNCAESTSTMEEHRTHTGEPRIDNQQDRRGQSRKDEAIALLISVGMAHPEAEKAVEEDKLLELAFTQPKGVTRIVANRKSAKKSKEAKEKDYIDSQMELAEANEKIEEYEKKEAGWQLRVWRAEQVAYQADQRACRLEQELQTIKAALQRGFQPAGQSRPLLLPSLQFPQMEPPSHPVAPFPNQLGHEQPQHPLQPRVPQHPFQPRVPQHPFQPRLPQHPYPFQPSALEHPYPFQPSALEPPYPFQPSALEPPYPFQPSAPQHPYPFQPSATQRPFQPGAPQHPFQPNALEHPFQPSAPQHPFQEHPPQHLFQRDPEGDESTTGAAGGILPGDGGNN